MGTTEVQAVADPGQSVEIEIVADDQGTVVANGPTAEQVQAQQQTSGPEVVADTGQIESQSGPDPIAELKRQLDALNREKEEANQRAHAERVARTEAEEYAVAAGHEVAQARGSVDRMSLQTIASELAAQKAEAEQAEAALATAHAASDPVAIAKAHRALSRAETRIVQLEDGESNLKAKITAQQRQAEAQRAQAAQQRQQPAAQQQPQSTGDPVEDTIRGLTPRTQNYLRSRDRSFVADQAKFDMLKGAHFTAKAEGHVVDSDSYFDRLDQIMGVKPNGGTIPAHQNGGAVNGQQPRKTPYAAPSSRGPETAAQKVNQVKIKLSPGDREMARASGVTENEWAMRIYKMREAMKDPTYKGPRFDPV